jgi:hypothetical protein
VTLVLASSMRSPTGHGGSSTALVVVLVVAVLVAGCLFLLFRRGSIADRARRDETRPPEPGSDQRT